MHAILGQPEMQRNKWEELKGQSHSTNLDIKASNRRDHKAVDDKASESNNNRTCKTRRTEDSVSVTVFKRQRDYLTDNV